MGEGEREEEPLAGGETTLVEEGPVAGVSTCVRALYVALHARTPGFGLHCSVAIGGGDCSGPVHWYHYVQLLNYTHMYTMFTPCSLFKNSEFKLYLIIIYIKILI